MPILCIIKGKEIGMLEKEGNDGIMGLKYFDCIPQSSTIPIFLLSTDNA